MAACCVPFQRFRKIGSMEATIPMKTRSLASTSRHEEKDASHSQAAAGLAVRDARTRHSNGPKRDIDSKLHPQPATRPCAASPGAEERGTSGLRLLPAKRSG